MRLLRSDIVDRLRENGDMATAHRAQETLPEEVDTEQDQGLLEQLGVDLDSLFDQSP
jgi:hypothetical protein